MRNLCKVLVDRFVGRTSFKILGVKGRAILRCNYAKKIECECMNWLVEVPDKANNGQMCVWQL